ncbi:AlpA family transcriptional regulator [Neoaquamicrobium sediminum]|uniref:AlpA family transcriptional regulator n=1 Tax=Neoaquamicrobium sediminum TaxID=1849104 RepID=UPI00156405DB|nr:AlpA family transcriptional regulator [Mesorhizobium sediminum]NRC55178.1 AlpA family transcriptional regulator [Mesorhizobium sediminum]
MTETILRREAVESATGLPRSTLYHFMKLGDFPKPVPIGGRAVGWLSSDIDAWIQSRREMRDNRPAGAQDGRR